MGTTFEDIYTDVINRLGFKINDSALLTKVKNYINDNYKLIANKYDWRWLYAKSTITTIAVYETGTVSLTNGSAIVTGSGTTFTEAMEGKKFKSANWDEIYTIDSVESSTSLTLDNEFNGDTITAGTYDIFQDIYALPTDCDQIVSLRQHLNPIKLDNIGLRELFRLNPSPIIEETDPTKYAYYEQDSSGNQQIILWPPPYRQIILDIEYKKLITELSTTTDEPLIPEQYRQILKIMTMVDVYAHEKDDTRFQYFDAKAMAMIAEMKGKFTNTDDNKCFVPETKRQSSCSLQALANRYDLGDFFDRA